MSINRVEFFKEGFSPGLSKSPRRGNIRIHPTVVVFINGDVL